MKENEELCLFHISLLIRRSFVDDKTPYIETMVYEYRVCYAGI